MKKKDSQYYSKIAKQYIKDKIAEGEYCAGYNMVTYGDLIMIEDLFDLFGGDRNYLHEKDLFGGQGQRYRFQYVSNRLDKESKKSDALFEKGYICYNGIINRPTRCYTLKEE